MRTILTTADAAEVLGITPSAISYRVRRGTLEPFAKLAGIRGAYLFEPSEIQRAKDGDAE